VSFILCGHDGYSAPPPATSAPTVRVDHDISFLMPEIWCRLAPQERDAKWLIERGSSGTGAGLRIRRAAKVLASRLGYRITPRFMHAFLGKIFDDPVGVFDDAMLRPGDPGPGQLRRGCRAHRRRPGEGGEGLPGRRLVRISKLMSEQGLCSRREADAYIERGWVFVDGVRVTELGSRAYADAEDHAQQGSESRTSSSAGDDPAQQAGRLRLRPGRAGLQAGGDPDPPPRTPATSRRCASARRMLKGLAPAGRLDIDSTGLLVLTQDGRIAKLLIGEDSRIEKEYLVRVEGTAGRGGLACSTTASRSTAAAEAGQGELAERGPAALHPARRPQAPDPPHVRTGRPEGHGLKRMRIGR
jgi:hypothetical protein